MPVEAPKKKRTYKKMSEKKEPAVMGRPKKYNPGMIERVRVLAESGMTNYQMAHELGCSLSSFQDWQNKYPDFLEAIKIGKEIADARVERALYELATGYEYDAQKPMTIGTGKGYSEVQVVEYREKVPPNPTAIIFWLKNRKPKEWRDKQEIGLTDSEGNDRAFSVEFIPSDAIKK